MTAVPAPLALSMGEPAGVGPEIIARAWAALRAEGPVFAVIGDAAQLRAQGQPVEAVLSVADAPTVFGRAIPVLDNPLPAPVTPGRPEPANAGAVADWIEQAVNLALSGEASGVVTAPIAKAPLYAAGFRFPGHTEFIAELTADARTGDDADRQRPARLPHHHPRASGRSARTGHRRAGLPNRPRGA